MEMRAQRCKWTAKFKRCSRTGLLFHQIKCLKLQLCSKGFSTRKYLETRLIYMTTQPCSRLLFLDHWRTEAVGEDFWLWPPVKENRPPQSDRKQTFRASTLQQMEWEILHLFYIVNVLSITESVQLISVYKKCNLQTKFPGWWQLHMRLSGRFHWSDVQWR